MINDKEVVIPSSLSEITLGRRIAFHEQHGRELEEMIKSISSMSDDLDKELEIMEFQFEKMVRSFSFFSNVSVEEIKESKFLHEIATIYYSCLSRLLEDEKELTLESTFYWNNEKWVLHPPELKHGSSMKFGELIDAKQLIKDMVEVGKGKWEYMLPICAIYLRKEGEEYKKEFLYEGSDRIKLMEELPMNIAMQVGFFLSGTINIYMNTSKFLESPEQKEEESSLNPISTGMVG